MTDRIDASINDAAPPADMAPALQALWWLRKGGFATGPAWERAHEICQASEGVKEFDWIHALAHWIEGDTSNAAYWYRRAGRGPGRRRSGRRVGPHRRAPVRLNPRRRP